jgi:hypothetical protein
MRLVPADPAPSVRGSRTNPSGEASWKVVNESIWPEGGPVGTAQTNTVTAGIYFCSGLERASRRAASELFPNHRPLILDEASARIQPGKSPILTFDQAAWST